MYASPAAGLNEQAAMAFDQSKGELEIKKTLMEDIKWNKHSKFSFAKGNPLLQIPNSPG